MAKKTVEQTKLRLKIKAYDHKVLDRSVKQIVDILQKQSVDFQGPVPLPTDIRRYTVNRSPFIDKESREQFEIRIHKRILDILNPNQKVIESLNNINLPAGVDIEMKA